MGATTTVRSISRVGLVITRKLSKTRKNAHLRFRKNDKDIPKTKKILQKRLEVKKNERTKIKSKKRELGPKYINRVNANRTIKCI